MTSDSHNTDDADRETLAYLERRLPRVTPSADLFDRILVEIQPEATVIPFRSRSHRRVVAAGATLAAVAAVIVVAFVERGNGPGRPDARAAISGKSDPAVTGQARLYGSTAAGGTVQVTLRRVPPAPRGEHYEVWVLRRNVGSEMEAIGSFTPTSQTVKLSLPLPGAGNYGAIDISVERDGGSPLHSDTSLASGAFS